MVIAAYLGGLLSLRGLQTRLIFFPPSQDFKTPSKPTNPIYEEIWIPVRNQKLNAWWIPSSIPNNPALLYLHGNASQLKDLKDTAQFFHSLKLSVLLIDYRGYGESQGEFPNEKRVYEDAQAAWEYLTNRRRISARNIWVYGHSLGGAIAIELARKNLQMGGVIVEGSFTSIGEMINHKIPWQIFPQGLILTQNFDSIGKVKSLRVPILFIHGNKDRVVPSSMSQKLFKASSAPKFLLIVPNAGHSNMEKIGGERYRQAIVNFMNSSQKSQR